MNLQELKAMLNKMSEEQLQQPLIILGYNPGMVTTGNARIASEPIHCRRWDFPYLDIISKSNWTKEWEESITDQAEIKDNIAWLGQQEPIVGTDGLYIEMDPNEKIEWPKALYNL